MTLLAQMIYDRLAPLGICATVSQIDDVLKIRNRILKDDDNHSGFNRDQVGYRTTSDGDTVRYTIPNPR